MAIVVSDTGGGGDFTPAPEGTHFGACDMVVDLGLQKTSYQGVESTKHQIYIRWQIPSERTEWTDGEGKKREGPVVIGKTYTASLGEKANLRKDLQSWRGQAFTDAELKGFDISRLLSAPATISITHAHKEGKTYANVSAIGKLPKNMDAPKVEGGAIIFDDENRDSWDKLPKWLKDKVSSQVVATGATDANDPDGWRNAELDDDVPF